jgi:thioesterase domain-containing protein
VDEDFFELGGDSLLAAQMLIEVERTLGDVVPMSDLVHARTVRGLAEVIATRRADGGVGAATSTVACVQAGDESARPRLWFVHDLQGSAWRIRHLAAALGPDQPVWSFESPLLRGEPDRFGSLDTFVARYLTDLRAAQPTGPYWVAGYSFGGICAYEMARQLRKDGEDVAFVGVVDVGPGYRGPGWDELRSPLRPWFGVAPPPPAGSGPLQKLRHYRAMIETSPKGALRHVMVRSGLARVVDPIRFRRDLHTRGQVRPEWRLWYAWEEHWKLAATAWDRDSRYDGLVHLFWATASAASDATMGWGPLVGELDIVRFPGDHEGILEPHGAPALADVLRPFLTR